MKTVKIFTLGCKVNQYDTQVLRECFLSCGYKEMNNGQKADIYVINTCTVTSTADRKSRYLIHYAHRENPRAKIVVTGCYTQLDSAEISRIPGVSYIIKNEEKDRIVKLLNEQNGQDRHNEPDEYNVGISSFNGHTRAFLKIQDGCNNFCTYCKVPLVRGAPRSKPLYDILKEANALVENGFKEIVLCGVCLGTYGKDLNSNINLLKVLRTLKDIPSLLRLRLSSLEPVDISDELIETIASSKIFCRHLHIPLQSGDDEILKKMNRAYSAEWYLKLIRKIKNSIPDIAITTDILVGFPGEKEHNFRNTLAAIKEILPLKVHIFPYSKRKETPAYSFKDSLSLNEIKIRIVQLRKIAQDCALKYKSQFINKNMEVLIEESYRDNPAFWCGLTDNYVKVLIKSNNNLKNHLILVRLKEIIKDYILADIV